MSKYYRYLTHEEIPQSEGVVTLGGAAESRHVCPDSGEVPLASIFPARRSRQCGLTEDKPLSSACIM